MFRSNSNFAISLAHRGSKLLALAATTSMPSTCIDCNWERNWCKASNLLSDIPRIACQKEFSLWWSVCLQPRTQTLEHWNCSSIFVLWQKWEQLLDPKLQVLISNWSLLRTHKTKHLCCWFWRNSDKEWLLKGDMYSYLGLKWFDRFWYR